ncbi:MAG TPA: hypothetical protein VFE44_05115, partial [Thermoanaerobaculia bacterium]|nr:hypothetical protein [Thermoanaerobaculia bacterium]
MELNINDDQGAESKMRNRNLWRTAVALGLALLAPAGAAFAQLQSGKVYGATFFNTGTFAHELKFGE